ncbi:probable beta-hexosaminidase fdl isoform X2 [Bacillus rossius redtenbacheri]|uniref:probable beta-hexosaminidase fdl isoform X2 n=1 Tax=Bacillus rossius redtenbacheri TaxID=93214 RepID=UPI002FDD5402
MTAGRRAMAALLVSKKAVLVALMALSVVAIIYWGTADNLQLVGLAPLRASPGAGPPPQMWTWRCEEGQCVRRERRESLEPRSSLSTCQMLCGPSPLWPRPTGVARLSTSYCRFQADRLQLTEPNAASAEVRRLLLLAGELFLADVRRLAQGGAPADSYPPDGLVDLRVDLRVTGRSAADLSPRLRLATNESYRLVVVRVDAGLRATVTARSFFGARHGLETLSQLAWRDEDDPPGVLRVLDGALVADEPRFPHRGLLVDSARNFLPVESLRRTVDAMAASKLNTLHWHLTDSQSFPLDAPREPRMARHGAYSARQTYSARDVAELVEHARARGVRVLAELDAPAHAGLGWQWGPAAGLGSLAVCVDGDGASWKERCGEPPCGQLNPTNNHTYRVLGQLYADLVELTHPTDEFHMGGDEVDFNCWANSPEVLHPGGVVTMEGMMELWGGFHRRALAELRRASGGDLPRHVIVWSSDLTKPEVVTRYLPRDRYVVQVWGPSDWNEMEALLSTGYRVVASHVNAWYLDCGYGSWRGPGPGSCGPYSTWQTVYEHRPWTSLRRSERALLLGGEACLWSEQADGSTLDERLWPRAAALAERLWTDPAPVFDADGIDDNLREAHGRLSQHRERLVARGVRAAAIWPRWCHQNPALCLEPKVEPIRRW